MEAILNNCIFAIPFVLIAEWIFYEKKMRPTLETQPHTSLSTAAAERENDSPKGSADAKWTQNAAFLHLAGIFVFAMMIAAILSVTGITPTSGFKPYIHGIVNLIPFKGVADVVSVANLNGGNPFIATNIFGNLILLLPIGFLLPLLWEPFIKFRNTLLFGMGVSVLIEFSQLFLIRATDIDDVILNTAGVAIGFGAFKVFQRFLPDFSLRCRGSNACRMAPFVFVGLIYVCNIVRGSYLMYHYFHS